MVADINRLYVGILLVIAVCFSYLLNLDIYLLSIIFFFVLYDLYKSNLINHFKLISIVIFTLIFFFLINEFEFLWNYLYLIQITFIFLTIIFSKQRNIFFSTSVCLFCLILLFINQADRYIFYLIIGISFFNDTIAYVCGSKIKGPLIIPNVSPKKTWSGTIISFTLSTIVLYLLKFNLLFSALTSIFLFLGDIFFSYIKRSIKVKDFSNSLGNHGGILDRLDSMFFISIFFQFYLVIYP